MGEAVGCALVTGATGKSGRRVVERLAKRGFSVRPGSRAGDPAFDWERPETWSPALRGMEVAYVAFQPDVAMPGAPQRIGEFAALATQLGVRRLVLLSGRGEPEAEACEDALRVAAREWTILRCSWFAQNFSEGFLAGAIAAGEVRLPVGAVPEPFVDLDDVADVAVEALVTDAHVGRCYELTGPRLLTFSEAVSDIAQVLGRPLRFTAISVEAVRAELGAIPLDDEVVNLLTYLFTSVLDGRNAAVHDDIAAVLGRPARDFRAFATAAFGSREGAR